MRRDLCKRIARFEKALGLTAEHRAFTVNHRRFEKALKAYETERDRIARTLPAGWRLVTDFLVKDGFVVLTRRRATNQPPEIENGVCIDVASRQVNGVSVQHGGLGSFRPPCEDDAKWRAEGDRALPEDLRAAIRALKPVDFLHLLNGKKF